MGDTLSKEFKTDIEGLIEGTGSSYCLLKTTVKELKVTIFIL